MTHHVSHLRRLENESIHIIREVVAECRAPVMLYSIGKDSTVMLHLALKAFYPRQAAVSADAYRHGWKFREMIAFRDETARGWACDLIVHTNEDGRSAGHQPVRPWRLLHATQMKTEALKQALTKLHGFDAAFGGARRDEEKSPRQGAHLLLPHRQPMTGTRRTSGRNSGGSTTAACNPGESIRVFPLSNWTELDIWHYILPENIPIVPLYFASRAPGGGARRQPDRGAMTSACACEPGETPEKRMVRFRSLGCYPLTGAHRSPTRRRWRDRRRNVRPPAPPSAAAG